MNRKRHLSKAVHNEDFFSNMDIDSSRFRDWIVVGIFYAVLHYYEAYFANSNRHSSSHDISDDWIAHDTNLSQTYDDYRELKQYRWEASYKSRNFSPQDIRDIILPTFNDIKSRIP